MLDAIGLAWLMRSGAWASAHHLTRDSRADTEARGWTARLRLLPRMTRVRDARSDQPEIDS